MRPHHRRHMSGALAALSLALLTLLGGIGGLVLAQPPAPASSSPTAAATPMPAGLPPEAQAALDAFRQEAPRPQQRIPFPIYQVGLPLAVAGESGAPTPTPEPAPAADVIVTTRPNPSIRVARDSQLAYVLQVRNDGAGPASEVQVMLPLDPAQLTLRNFSSDEEGDFVSDSSPEQVVVTFGALEPDTRRGATLLFDVSDALPDDTTISMRASYSWQDERQGGEGRGNWAPVLVGDFNNSSRYLFLELLPERGPQGTFFNAYTDRFVPREPITAWLNTPEGVEPLDLRLAADRFGRVELSISSAGLAPAAYELVLYGQRSRLTAVQGFVVE